MVRIHVAQTQVIKSRMPPQMAVNEIMSRLKIIFLLSFFPLHAYCNMISSNCDLTVFIIVDIGNQDSKLNFEDTLDVRCLENS